MALVEHGRHRLLAQLLVGVPAQGLGHVVERVLPVAGEVVVGEARRQHLLGEQVGELRQVVAVDGPFEDHRLLVAVDADVRGQRVERVEQLGVGAALAAALAQHFGGEGGQPLLALRIVDGADLEEQANGAQRARRRGQEHGADAGDAWLGVLRAALAAGLAGAADGGVPRGAAARAASGIDSIDAVISIGVASWLHLPAFKVTTVRLAAAK